MINNNDKELFSRQKFEEIIKNNMTDLHQSSQSSYMLENTYFKFLTLAQAGYNIRAIELINEFILNSVDITKDFLLKLLLILCDSYFDCLNYSEIQKVLNKIRIQFPDLDDEYKIFLVKIYDLIVNRTPIEFSEKEVEINQLMQSIIQTQNSDKLTHFIPSISQLILY